MPTTRSESVSVGGSEFEVGWFLNEFMQANTIAVLWRCVSRQNSYLQLGVFAIKFDFFDDILVRLIHEQ
jgi:hypothetical protein